MNRIPKIYINSFILLCLSIDAHAADSLLRITCEGDDVGAEIMIDGKFKGECPVDIKVPEGSMHVKITKTIDENHERVFESYFRMAGGTIKKVEVIMSTPRLNAAAQAIENKRLKSKQIEAENRQRLVDAVIQKEKQAAEAGDSAAMVAMGDRYSSGEGVKSNVYQAIDWYHRAANAGNDMGAFKLSNFSGSKDEMDAAMRLLQLPKSQERIVDIEGLEKMRAFMDGDHFFSVPGGAQEASWSTKTTFQKGTRIMHSNFTCSRESKYFKRKDKSTSDGFSQTRENLEYLGGLIVFDSKTSRGFFSSDTDTKTETVRIDKLYGQPFPLQSGQRFGMESITSLTFSNDAWNKMYAAKLKTSFTCSLDNGAAKLTDDRIICLYIESNKDKNYSSIVRYSWDEPSGCFKMLRFDATQ